MGNWKFPLVDKMAVDLFWNAASFQEMEPDVVANYLQYVNKSARNVYLQELMEGQIKAKGVGSKGVIQKTTLEDYQKGLSQFNMVNLSKCWTPLGISDQYSDSFWKLKNN